MTQSNFILIIWSVDNNSYNHSCQHARIILLITVNLQLSYEVLGVEELKYTLVLQYYVCDAV